MTKDPKELAKTLQANGIAFSDKQALDMAEGMIGTGEKVTDSFNEKKEEILEGYKRPSSKIDMNNPYVRDNVKRMREAAMQSTPVDVQTDYEIPVEDEESVDSYEPETVEAEEVTEVELPVEEVLESLEPETVEETEVFEELDSPVVETEDDDPEPEEDPVDPEDKAVEPEEESLQEEAAEETESVESKDTSAEESVDLNKMFKFGD